MADKGLIYMVKSVGPRINNIKDSQNAQRDTQKNTSKLAEKPRTSAVPDNANNSGKNVGVIRRGIAKKQIGWVA